MKSNEVERRKEKLKNFFKNRKQRTFIISAIIVLILIIVIVLFLTNSKKVDLEKSLENMGKDFYENFYYKQIGKDDNEKKEFLKKYETMGIKVSLDNLERYDSGKNKDEVAKFKNEKTGKECDKTNTLVIIYPQEPYEKTSYRIESILSCEN